MKRIVSGRFFTKRVSHSLIAILFATTIGFLPASAGTWTNLLNPVPGNVRMLLLLSDGSVMAQNANGNGWYRLQPDTRGNYARGGWTPRAAMNSTRTWYSSAVLRDGRVFVAGAEYGNGWLTSEVYDPENDSWTSTPVPLSLLQTNNSPPASGQNTAGFSDSGCKILPDGRVLVAPVYPITANGNAHLQSCRQLMVGRTRQFGKPE